MSKALASLFLFFIMPQYTGAQISPKENSKLNYRLVGFSFPPVKGVKEYTIEIAAGYINTEDAFNKSIISALKTDKNKLIAEVPSFGKEYTWRTVCTAKGSVNKSSMHHFSSIISSEVDTLVTRLNILKSAEKYKDAYVFMDGSNALYDMKGNPVWYVPVTGVLNPKKSKLWDMKLTPQGTITFLLDQNIYEINYNGAVLWKGPDNGKVSGDSIEYYHHEFTRLANGHYMVTGTEFVSWAIPALKDSIAPHFDKGDKTKNGNTANSERTAFGTIIEYDHEGNVVWSWRSSAYFKNIDPKYLRSDAYNSKSAKQMVDVHENAFYFDEKEKAVYLCFKNISSILKIKYPEGNVLNVYGKLANLSGPEKVTDLFCGQHSPKISQEGYLYLYNNNACHTGALPQVLMFEQPKAAGDTLRKIWEYNCDLGDVYAEKQKEAAATNNKDEIATPEQISSLEIFSKGGNIIELPDHSIFASICGIYGKVFIITPDKKTTWSAILETWNPYKRKWDDIINYKANIIINPKDLETLIWNAEKN